MIHIYIDENIIQESKMINETKAFIMSPGFLHLMLD